MTKAAELAKIGEVLTNSQIGGRRNIVINGAMQVSQRSTSATGVGGDISYHSLDRFLIEAGHTAGRLTFAQVADVHDGFSYATKLTCTTADTSIGADEYTIFSTRLEGQDLQHLKKGTSDAKKVTVSFYVKGNASATYTVELRDNDNGRFNSQEFPVTTDWVRITRTFTGDTTGSFDNDNALSLKLNFWLHAGSAYTGGTHVSNTWGTTSNQRVGDNQTSFFDSTDRTFFITGVQLEVGEQATPFEHRSFGEELALCERYFQILLKHGDGSDGGVAVMGATASMYSTSYMTVPIMLRTPMRSSPSLISANSSGCFRFYRSNGNDVFDDLTAGSARNKYALEMYNNSDMSGTQGDSGFIQTDNSNAILSVDAEL